NKLPMQQRIIYWRSLRCCHGNSADAQSSLTRNRHELRLVSKESLMWHPGHIHKGRKRINQKLAAVDAFVEVHDARIPITGRARLFEDSRAARPHALVLNKADLVAPSARASWKRFMEEREGPSSRVFHCSLRTSSAELGRTLTSLMSGLLQLASQFRPDKREFNIMIAGVPNVGKSSLINALRTYHSGKKAAARVGKLAGVTRVVGERILVCQDPPVYVLDSPGILDPEFKDDIGNMLKLGACGCMDLNQIDSQVIADYLLHLLNVRGERSYVKLYDLEGPVTDVRDLLAGICRKHRLVQAHRNFHTGQLVHGPNLVAGAQALLRHFNQGLLGRLVLDQLPSDLPADPPLPFAYSKGAAAKLHH
ncbi:hypothetical protein BOX15_Mlig017619g4, partial [Macrostomum lignano]